MLLPLAVGHFVDEPTTVRDNLHRSVSRDEHKMKLTLLATTLLAANALTAAPTVKVVQPPIRSLRGGQVSLQAPPAGVLALPPAGYEGAVAAGTKKAGMAVDKIFALGMLSGAHIGFGAFLMLSVGGACPGLVASNPGLQKIVLGSFGLPFGLLMTLVTGAELFTGNTALVTTALLEGKASLGELIKSWSVSYAGNFVGSLALAAAVTAAGTLAGGGASVGVAVAKTSLSFKAAFFRGVLCNWLVRIRVQKSEARESLWFGPLPTDWPGMAEARGFFAGPDPLLHGKENLAYRRERALAFCLASAGVHGGVDGVDGQGPPRQDRRDLVPDLGLRRARPRALGRQHVHRAARHDARCALCLRTHSRTRAAAALRRSA